LVDILGLLDRECGMSTHSLSKRTTLSSDAAMVDGGDDDEEEGIGEVDGGAIKGCYPIYF
jgi:hypothetical protein